MLDLFLIDLIQTGQVTVSRELVDFEASSPDQSVVLLQAYYDADKLHMPYDTPEFHPQVALWAAGYLYNTIQLVLIRDADVAKIDQLLQDYKGNYEAAEIYSADLMLRFLPDIFKLASGLSPNDPLIERLKSTAQKWPLSSVGIENISASCSEELLAHPSLSVAYIDRIIEKKDISRAKGKVENRLLKEVLGIHQAKLWPNLNLILNEETT